jgi:hypothetical protein
MKPIIPLTLVVAVATEFATEALHEISRDNPHVEQKISSLTPSASTTNNLSSGGDAEPLGSFRSRVFARESRRANISKDEFAMHGAWLATARAMMRDRTLNDWQRVMQYEILKQGIATIYQRTSGKINCYGVLSALAAALNIPSGSVHIYSTFAQNTQ